MKHWFTLFIISIASLSASCASASEEICLNKDTYGQSNTIAELVSESNFIGIYKAESPSSILNEKSCLLYTSPSPRDQRGSRMPSSA